MQTDPSLDAHGPRVAPALRTALRRTWKPLVALGLFALALTGLHRELARHDPAQILALARATPPAHLLLALIATLASYGLLTLYDVLALRHIGHPLPYGRTALTSFTSYVASHNLGLSGLGGSAVRLHLYTAWGLGVGEIAEVIAFCGLTFWLGFLGLAGVAFTLSPVDLPGDLPGLFASTRPLGVLCWLGLGALVLWSRGSRAPLRVRHWRFRPPPPGQLGLQLGLAALDWLLAACVLFVLLPAGHGLDLGSFVGVFLAAQTLGMVSHVPAGLGVFETACLYLLPGVPHDQLLGSLLVYRAVYYLLPLALGVLTLLVVELFLRRRLLARVGRRLDLLGRLFVPRALALSSAAAGALLLLTGALPTATRRLELLRHFLPLPVLEFSHFLGSLVGALLLLLSRGLARRLDAAWWLSVLGLGAGALLALLRGLDVEEACGLSLLLVLMLPYRREFHRRASLLHLAWSPRWLLALGVVLASSIWLGLLVHRQVEYSGDLWWHFAYEADAPRFLRASAGASALLGLVACARLLRAVPPPQELPGEADLERVRAILASEPRTQGHLALLGDKALLFDETRSAFLMYGVRDQSWIALGEPIGASEALRRELVWRFRELAERAGGRPAFYQVGPEHREWFAEAGFGLLKLGEEARVDLAAFGLEGRGHKGLRSALHRGERLGWTFRVLPAAEVADHERALQDVSEAWLRARNAREKRFSLGFFHPPSLRRAPVAVVRHDRRLLAFANLLQGAPGGELSVDLMRHLPGENGVMDFLFLQLLHWGREQGYRWFSLGMAPLAGLEPGSATPLWSRIATLLAEHGEAFYGFRGLRRYKDKFDPAWEPRYLASPGGLSLPRLLLDVTELISGGLLGTLGR